MANEIAVDYESGQNLYAIVRNAALQVWQTTTSTFVAWVDANFANYDIALTEQGTSGFYYANFPTAITTPGLYSVEVRRREGGSPHITNDKKLGTDTLPWNGTAEVTMTELATAAAVSTVGTAVGAVNTAVGTVGTAATAIKAKTDNLPAAPAAVSDVRVRVEVAG